MEPIKTAKLQWDENQQPHSLEYDDCYFSEQCSTERNGLAESRYVFLKGNQLEQRWKSLSDSKFVIAETGFGSGLNFIAAWELWLKQATPSQHLYFISTEKHPLTIDDLKKASSLWPKQEALYQQLIEQYPSLTPGFHYLNFSGVTLLLILGEAEKGFQNLLESDHPSFNQEYGCKVDAWFLDGFSPAKNPELWTDTLFQQIASLSKLGTTAATFTCAGIVKRGLKKQDFKIQKINGFGSKREMLTAELTEKKTNRELSSQSSKFKSPYMAPWYIHPRNEIKKVAIIGAGIAGCTLAHSLAKKNIQVSIFDKYSSPATQTSGNQQAVLYNKLSANDNMLSQFSLSAFLYALRFYSQKLKHNPALIIQLSGLLQTVFSEKDSLFFERLKPFFIHYPEIIQFLNQEQASNIAGVKIDNKALFFPNTGWINPANVCQNLLLNDNIHFYGGVEVDNAFLEEERRINQADAVVVAGGPLSHQFSTTESIPHKNIRGQVSHIAATPYTQNLKTVLCGEGYITPASDHTDGHERQHSLGATYNIDSSNHELNAVDHEHNLSNLSYLSRSLAEQWQSGDINDGKVGFRATTPDYLPLCGPVPKQTEFIETYDELRRNAKANIPITGPYHPNLYLFSGLGSRGMTYAPLCAELLSSQILNTPSPLPQKMAQSLSPARFIIRKLIKDNKR